MIERYTNPEMGAVWDEENKFRRQLEVELAVCQARFEAGEIPPVDWEAIRDKADFKLERINEIEKTVDHETIALLTAVAEFVGPASRHIHVGMTSSDVLDTSFALQLVQAVDLLLKDIDELIDAVRGRAIEHKDTIMMGRTHGIHAEPITFGLKLAIWYEELKRSRERLVRAREAVRVGKISGAVGTYAHIPPETEKRALEILGLEPASISNQVIQRDRYAEYASAVAICASSIDKFATEVRHLARTEVGEVLEPFRKGQKGSSAMPHKRNPMRSERMSGMARLIRGYLQAALENIPLWHERDISHSSAERVIFPDATILLDYMLRIFKNTVEGMEVFPERMRANMDLSYGVVFSQRVMLALCEKGMTRENAYKIIQRLGHKALDEKRMFQQLVKEKPEITKLLSNDEIKHATDPAFFLKHVDEIFGRLGLV